MHPYQNLPVKAFWAKAVADKNSLDIAELWNPKWKITRSDTIVTFGSCFAQHFGNALENSGYNWLNAEPAPHRLNIRTGQRFNYGIFSARTANIYTTSMLRQWTRWSLNKSEVPDELWLKGERFYDPFRPTIEPDGFASEDELRISREMTLEAFRSCIEKSDYFVFTLGLTESWLSKSGSYEYPICPGTAVGTFDEDDHVFRNQDYNHVSSNLTRSMDLMRRVNPDLKFLLTVSPVPLVATKSTQHVLIATTYSKSVLRAVAGDLANTLRHVDYFPSFEIINSHPYRGNFYEPNLRTVANSGVDHVMNTFFDCLYKKYPQLRRELPLHNKSTQVSNAYSDLACEEQLLEAFSATT